ncbi:MAG: glycosyltransferase [Alphaproteobacteria bacterium]|nr:glycosyltransferase [Alphaproteobacteria bacterium]
MSKLLRKIFHKKHKSLYHENAFVTWTKNLSMSDIEANRKFTKNMQGHVWKTPPKRFMFFSLCSLDFLAGGFKTHMDLMQAIHDRLNAKIYICFIPEASEKRIEQFNLGMQKYYPNLNAEIVSVNMAHNIETDVCISLGMATSEAIKYNKCKEKYLHAMDYEALFYSSGTESTITDFLYSQGFYVFTNSLALKKIYQNLNPGTPIFRYVPGIDEIYYPDSHKKTNTSKFKMVVYARPGIPRNAFSLLVPVFKSLKQEFMDKLEIILVGQTVKLSDYGLKGVCTALGKLNSLSDLAQLYRSCDMGISLITTPTFSYMHLQLMASGICLITNDQCGVSDFLEDGKNAVVVPPVANIIASRISELIRDPEKMHSIAHNGQKTVAGFTWDKCFGSIIDFITQPK